MIGRSERKWLVLSGQAIKHDAFKIPTWERFGGSGLIEGKY